MFGFLFFSRFLVIFETLDLDVVCGVVGAVGRMSEAFRAKKEPSGSFQARQTFKHNGLICQWVDRIQRARLPPCRSLFNAFSDGQRLVALAERFCGRSASGVVENPRYAEDKLANVRIAVSMLEQRVGFKLAGVDKKAIVKGSAEQTSALLTWIILEFDSASDLAGVLRGECCPTIFARLVAASSGCGRVWSPTAFGRKNPWRPNTPAHRTLACHAFSLWWYFLVCVCVCGTKCY